MKLCKMLPKRRNQILLNRDFFNENFDLTIRLSTCPRGAQSTKLNLFQFNVLLKIKINKIFYLLSTSLAPFHNDRITFHIQGWQIGDTLGIINLRLDLLKL